MITDGKCLDCCHPLRGGKCTNAECDSSPYHARIKELESQLTAIVGWLETNQPDLWKRGLWDALHKTDAR